MGNDAPEICDACGGTGQQQSWWGPFLLLVPPEWREHVQRHIERRHLILKQVDRSLARQLYALLGRQDNATDLLDVVADSATSARDACTAGAWEPMVKHIMDVLTISTWVLESYGDVILPPLGEEEGEEGDDE